MDVSVIIPAYNSEKTIEATVKSVLNQSFKGLYEIIVVDDGSKDKTAEVVSQIKDKKVVLVRQSNKGPASARNCGARKAKGNIILLTDSDCVAEKNWIEEMVRPFRNSDIVGAQGRYKILNKKSLIARFVQYEIEERYQRMEKLKQIDFIGSYSAGYRRDVFLKFGGFDESFKTASGEDPEISYRMADKGLKMVFAPKAIVHHPHPDSLKRYLKMKYGRGYWGQLLYKKHPEKRKGQAYNSMFYFLHIPVTCLLSLLAVVFLPINYSFSLMSIILLIAFSMPSAISMAKFEKKFILIAPILINLRNLAIGYGIVMAKIKGVGKRP